MKYGFMGSFVRLAFARKVPVEDEYYITHKQCGICKLAQQEGVSHIMRYLCAMDYYIFEIQGAVP